MSAGEKCGRFWRLSPSSAGAHSSVGRKCPQQVRDGPHWMSAGRECGPKPVKC